MTQGFAKITPVSFLAYCCVLLPQREELVKIFLGESEIHLHVVVLFKNEKKNYFIAIGFIIYLVSHPIIHLALNNNSTSKENPQKHSENQ